MYHHLSPTCSLCNLILIEWKKYITIVRDIPLKLAFQKALSRWILFHFHRVALDIKKWVTKRVHQKDDVDR